MDKISAYNYIRSKFVELKETRALIKRHNLKIKYGFLSTEETQKVREVIDKFLLDRNLTMNDFRRNLVENTEFPIHDLLYECTQACIYRTYKSIHTHVTYMYHPYIHITWNQDQEIQLLDLVNQKGFKWKEISYHLSKYKDLCRSKYLKIKEENRKGLSKNRIEELLSDMPSTDQEWAILCDELKLSRQYILRLINRHLNGKRLIRKDLKELEIRLCLLILNNNHYCKFSCDIEKIMAFLKSDSMEFIDRIDGNTTPFFSQKGKRGGYTYINGKYARPYTNTDSTRDYPEDEFEALLESIKTESKENSSQTRFLNKFLDFFHLNSDFNLDVMLRKEDIFWLNITKEINIDKSCAYAKLNQLAAMYHWNYYKDIYDSVFKMAYDFVISETKRRLIEQNDANKNNGIDKEKAINNLNDAKSSNSKENIYDII